MRDGILKLSEIARNFARFWPQVVLGQPPPRKFVDMHYKKQPISNHVAKFHSDQPSKLGDLALKKNINSKT